MITETIYDIIIKTIERIKYVFYEHTFKSEHLMLIEIGAILGYILIIVFLFIVQYKSLQRSLTTNKHPIYILMVLDIVITMIVLSMVILPVGFEVYLLSFVVYIVCFMFIERSKDYYTDEKRIKHIHSNS